MLEAGHGDMLCCGVEALVNTVNCVGVMGKGIALQFKRAYPANFEAYKRACDAGEVRVGRMFVFATGLMHNPKAGTVTFDVARAVRETKAGKIEFRVDKAGNVQAAIGKVSFALESLETNFSAFMDQIVRMKPASSKGVYVRNVSVSSTMGPGIRIDPNPYR